MTTLRSVLSLISALMEVIIHRFKWGRLRKVHLLRIQERSEEEGTRNPIVAEIFAKRLHEDSLQRAGQSAPHLWLRRGSYQVLGQVPWLLLARRRLVQHVLHHRLGRLRVHAFLLSHEVQWRSWRQRQRQERDSHHANQGAGWLGLPADWLVLPSCTQALPSQCHWRASPPSALHALRPSLLHISGCAAWPGSEGH